MSAQPRVALFTDTFDEVSGVGKTFTRLAGWCERHRYPLHVFTVGMGETTHQERGSVTISRIVPRAPVEYYPGLVFDAIPLDDTALTVGREREFDVIHVATPGHMGITGAYLAARQGLPVIGSYHTELPQYISTRLLAQLGDEEEPDLDARAYVAEVSEKLAWEFLSDFYNYCSLVLAPSEATRQSLAPHLRVPVGLFSRGIDADAFSPRHRRRQSDRVRVLYVGRLAIEKNLQWLVQAAQQHPEWEVWLVGDGPERERLRAALPQAHLAGFLDGAELAQAYADADLFAFPSQTETFGNVVLEAQASGLPAVVGDEGGPREIIEEGRTGLVARSAEEFGTHLARLAADAELRRRMSEAGRARAASRSWDEIFSALWGTWVDARYPWRRRVWVRFLRRLRSSDHPLAVGVVAFWRQFGRRRAARARDAQLAARAAHSADHS